MPDHHDHIPDHIWLTFTPEATQELLARIEQYGDSAAVRVDVFGLHGALPHVHGTLGVVGDDDGGINESQIHPPP